MRDKKQMIALVAVGLLLVVSVVGGLAKPYIGKKPAPPATNSAGDTSQNTDVTEDGRYPVPDFKFADMDEKEVSFNDFKGKPIVLNFWATWCPFCVQEMADFDKLMGEYKDDVNFIMLDALDGKRETVDLVKKYVEEQKFAHLVPYLDNKLEGISVFGVTNFPTTVFIDKDGNMFTAIMGKTNYDDVKKILDEELNR